MAALEFHLCHDNRVAQALAIPRTSEAFGRASPDQRPHVLLSLTEENKIWGHIGFDQSLCLPFEKAVVSNTQRIQLLLANLANLATNNYGQETEYLPAGYAPITTRPWFCHQCGESHSLATPRCVNCHHDRCPYCTVE